MPEAGEVHHAAKSGLNIHTIGAGFIIAYGSPFQFGYHQGVLNQPSQHINSFYNETYKARRNGVPLDPMHITVLWSITTAVMYVPGGIVGALIGAWLADALGRRMGILVSQIFMIIGIILCVTCVQAKSPELLMLGRIFIGVSCGIGNCIAPMFLQEIVQANPRGAFGALHHLFVSFGLLVTSIFGHPLVLGAENRWQYLMLLAMIPVAATFVFLPFIHESPRFLLLIRKDADAARRSLQYYRMSKEVDVELNEIQDEGRAMETLQKRTIRQMFASDIRVALLICCMLQVIKQFSGMNAVFFYTSSIFADAGVAPADIPNTIIGTNALYACMSIVVVKLMYIAGRRPLLLIPIVAMIVILSCLTVCLHFQRDHPFTANLSIVCILLYVVAVALGLGPIPWMVGSELFRQDARSKAMAAGAIVNPLSTFIIALSFEPVHMILHYYTFIIFIGCLCCSFLFIYFLVPETKNRTFDEVAAELAGDEERKMVTPEVL